MGLKRFLASLGLAAALLALPLGTTAQQSGEQEDAGFLERTIQNALGGEGRTVRVSGLRGALSSQVSIATIEISDADGVWLSANDIVLDWRRVALLRRRLEVERLTVGSLDILRQPLPVEQSPSLSANTQAQPFSLPQLPVAVNVGELALQNVHLGAPVIGQDAELSVEGTASLANGEGSTQLALRRIDGKEGNFDLEGGFDNGSRRLNVNLSVVEEQGGIIATAARIPGAPSLELSVQGDDPIDDFLATISLRTDDVVRLSGEVTIDSEITEGSDGASSRTRVIGARLGGDVAPLVAPDYKAFFGRDVGLSLRMRQDPATGFDIENLDLRAQAMTLTGGLSIGPDGWPTRIDLDGDIRNNLGLPVVLPLAGPKMIVDNAQIDVSYDRETGDAFNADIVAEGFMRADGTLIDRVRISADGTLQGAGPEGVGQVSSDVTASVAGLSLADTNVWQAVGDAFDLTGRIDWAEGQPIRFTGLDARVGDVALRGDLALDGLGTGEIAAVADVSLVAPDLGRFSALAGQRLAGGLDANLDGRMDFVTGGFDATLTGTARDISVGNPNADDLLAGENQIDLHAVRNDEGIALDRLSIAGQSLDIAGSAAITAEGWPRLVDLAGRIGSPGGAPIALPLPGGTATLRSADIDVKYDAEAGDDFTATIAALDVVPQPGISVGSANLNAAGTLTRGQTQGVERVIADVNLSAEGLAADQPGLAQAMGSSASASARLDWLNGGPALLNNLALVSGDTRLSGNLRADGLDAGDPRISGRIALEAPRLARFAALAGQPLRGAVSATVEGDVQPNTGLFTVQASADGAGLGIGNEMVDQIIAGPARIEVQANRGTEGIILDRFVLSTNELSANASGRMTSAEGGAFDVTARLRDLGVVAPDFRGPLGVDGRVTTAGGVWSVNGTMDGPGGTRANVTGDVLRPDGTMRLRADGSLPLGLANAMILPRSIQGVANFDIGIDGPPGLSALSGTIRTSGARLSDPATQMALEQLATTITIANSRANLDLGGNLSTGGRIAVSGPVALTAPYSGNLSITLDRLRLIDPTLYEINLSGRGSVDGPLAGGARIAAQINVDRAEIQIPSGHGTGTLLDIVHRYEPPASYATRQRAGLTEQASSGGGSGASLSGPSYPLDIRISAPNEIFVRGRGLDVEMGGDLTIGGTTTNIRPSGGFELIRGRLNLLGQRLDFDQARIDLQGSLIPELYMVASSQTDDIRANITIEGPVTDPEITLSSDPELPEDEVLAHLFFGRSLSELSPLQVASLAAGINELSGGRGGFFGSLRRGLGVDDLDVTSGEDGGASVTAGKRINERLYTDVTVGSGTTEIHLNFDLTPSLTARGGFDNAGDTSIGIHFERDY